MNQTQRKYVLLRIDELKKRVRRKIEDKHKLKPNQIKGSALVKRIKEGKIKLDPDYRTKKVYNSSRITDFFVIPNEQITSLPVIDNEAFDREWNETLPKFDAARDKAMLGDCQEALDILKELEKLC